MAPKGEARSAGSAAALTGLDCLRCGACCCNPRENRDESYTEYLEVTARDRDLRRRTHLMKRYTATNARGETHLKLAGPEQRCAALDGAVGREVECTIYQFRPAGCRRLQPGDARCLEARRERGIDP